LEVKTRVELFDWNKKGLVIVEGFSRSLSDHVGIR